jgi:hypothetical protein
MENKQTAVEWLEDKLPTIFKEITINKQLLEQAKEMEKEQITKTARQCHFEGVRQSAKTSEEYIAYGEQYYNETYGCDK